MPGRRRDEAWDSRIFELTQQNPKMGPKPLQAELLKLMRADGGDQSLAPSERTIARRQEYFRNQNPEWRRQFDFFHFPESVQGDLPPEAAGHAFELWRHLRRRPTVRMCRAFHLVTLAVGEDVDPYFRRSIAFRILAAETNTRELRRIDQLIADKDFDSLRFLTVGFFPSQSDDEIALWLEHAYGERTADERDFEITDLRQRMREAEETE
jgi:hypothetical protein